MGQSRTDKGFLRNTVAWALLGLAAAGTAHAQTAEPATPAPAVAADDEEIVVTGSRIRSNEFNSASPIQVITTERGTLTGVADVAELLQSSSLAAGSPQNDATISSAFVTEGGPGSQTVSLRGLGANRTLVLVNGRRGGPAGVRGQVSAFDLNVIPLSAVDRFEILKDGASSIYGSDAVAGVVNIITDRDIDGGSVEISATAPWETGGAEYGLEGIWGTTFDRGYFTASFDYYKQNELRVGDRERTNCRADYTFSTATGLRDDRIDPRTGRPACLDILSGQVWTYEYSSTGAWASGQPRNSPNGVYKFQWDPGNVIGSLLPESAVPTPVDPTNPNAPPGWVGLGFTRATQGALNSNPEQLLQSSLIPELQRATIFLQAGYDITSSVEAYGELLLNRRKSRTNGVRQFWTYLWSYDYTYGYGYGPGSGDSTIPGWTGNVSFSPTPVTDHFDADQTVDYARFVGGMRGQFGGPLGAVDWDVFIQGSRSDAEYSQDVILDDAVRSAQYRNDLFEPFAFGNSIPRPTASCVGYNTPISNRPCVDVDWLSPDFLNGNPTPEERAFLFDNETGTTVYDQIYMEGILSGDVFTLPAGNVGAAVGFHIRRDEINDEPGEVTQAGNSWGLSTAGVTKGADTIKEVFGEVRIPILRGAPLAEDISLSLSGRYTDVESFGSDSTYKVGLNWQILPAWRVRATTGTSFRAPALFEQFLNDQTSFAGQRAIDPCINWAANLAADLIPQNIADNCAADNIPGTHGGGGGSARILTGGSLTPLNAETSEARTFGIIWRPSFTDLSVAVDYFDIEVSDEVTQLGPAVIMFGCYNSTHFATEPLCDLFTRGTTASPYNVNTVTDRYLNVATQANRGIDLTTQYVHEFPWGDFTFNSQFTWQFEDSVALVEGITNDVNGRVGDPKFVGNVDLRLDRGDWTLFWGIDMVGPSSDKEFIGDTNVAGTRQYVIDTEFVAYHDLSFRYRFDRAELTFGIANISDESPPALTSEVLSGGSATQGTSVLASQYDYIGRRMFISVRQEF
jgi:iron complex outermembrane receptor protein